jgi:hypothetical protein
MEHSGDRVDGGCGHACTDQVGSGMERDHKGSMLGSGSVLRAAAQRAWEGIPFSSVSCFELDDSSRSGLYTPFQIVNSRVVNLQLIQLYIVLGCTDSAILFCHNFHSIECDSAVHFGSAFFKKKLSKIRSFSF